MHCPGLGCTSINADRQAPAGATADAILEILLGSRACIGFSNRLV